MRDGRGKRCGRALSERVEEIAPEGVRWVVSICPKHDLVGVEESEFIAAKGENRETVLFDWRVGGLDLILADEESVARRLRRA